MPGAHRPLLSLLALSTLAVLAALAACQRGSEEPATRVIPPATPYLAPVARAAPPPAPAPAESSPAPSPEEVRAFERPVPK